MAKGSPAHCRTVSSLPGLCPPDACSAFSPGWSNQPTGQVSPGRTAPGRTTQGPVIRTRDLGTQALTQLLNLAALKSLNTQDVTTHAKVFFIIFVPALQIFRHAISKKSIKSENTTVLYLGCYQLVSSL